jgi:spore coat protein U-like protein
MRASAPGALALSFQKPGKVTIGAGGLLAVIGLFLQSAPAQAATLTVAYPMSGVSVSVPASCLASATHLAFGDYTGAMAVATATVTVNCTGTTPYAVGLDAGLSAGATVTTRRLTGPGGATLAYGLFQDKARTVNWGEATGGDSYWGVGTGEPQTLTLYAAEAAGQASTPGTYADKITITVSY